jgi:hypothetical protein
VDDAEDSEGSSVTDAHVSFDNVTGLTATSFLLACFMFKCQVMCLINLQIENSKHTNCAAYVSGRTCFQNL